MALNQKTFIGLIKYPIIKKKTIQLLQANQYSFAVDKKANKISIKTAIEDLFNVKAFKDLPFLVNQMTHYLFFFKSHHIRPMHYQCT